MATAVWFIFKNIWGSSPYFTPWKSNFYIYYSTKVSGAANRWLIYLEPVFVAIRMLCFYGTSNGYIQWKWNLWSPSLKDASCDNDFAILFLIKVHSCILLVRIFHRSGPFADLCLSLHDLWGWNKHLFLFHAKLIANFSYLSPFLVLTRLCRKWFIYKLSGCISNTFEILNVVDDSNSFCSLQCWHKSSLLNAEQMWSLVNERKDIKIWLQHVKTVSFPINATV